jgi:hypothetical protein
MPATDALESRALVLDDLMRSGTMCVMMDAAAESFSHSVEFEGKKFLGTPILAKGTRGEDLRGTLVRALSASEAFWVSKDMLSLAVAGAEMMPDDSLVEGHIVPAPLGWMLFQEPISVTDIRGKLLRFHAVSWSVLSIKGQPGVVVYWWTHKYDEVDSVNIQSRTLDPGAYSRLPLYTLAHISTMAFDRPIPRTISISGPGGAVVPPEAEVKIFEKDGTITWVLPTGLLVHSKEEGRGFIPLDQSGEYRPTEMPSPDLRVLTVIWRLMRQTITDVSDSTDRVPAYLRKTIKRQNTSERVSVIALRKTIRTKETGRTVEWSHRFLRRGHWRHQWFGPRDDRRQEWVWIHPSIVNAGREDLPLLVREHVNALIR